MKKKQKISKDVPTMMAQIQGQLAVLDQKLDSFMTKSLTELAQALAASRPVVRPQVQAPHFAKSTQNEFPPRRPMYAVICYECGKDSELPFKPSGNRPVYCKECFAKRKGRTVNPAAATSSVVSFRQLPPESAPPVKVKKKATAGKTAKAQKKVSRKPTAKKKPAIKKKTAVKRKIKRK